MRAHFLPFPILLLSLSALHAGTPLTTERVAAGLNRPVLVAHAPGDFDRLFVVEQRGVIKILDLLTGAVRPVPFLDIDDLVLGPLSGFDERGLLGFTFHPNYETNGFFYVNYTNLSADTTVARYSVGPDPDVADPTSATIVLTIDQPFDNHNGGWISLGAGAARSLSGLRPRPRSRLHPRLQDPPGLPLVVCNNT